MLNKRLVYLTLVFLCFLSYANSLNNAFISDDIPAILENPKISQSYRYWFEPSALLDSLSYRIAGHNTFIYHLISIILHSLNTVLVFLFLNLLSRLREMPPAYPRMNARNTPSFLAASLFAVHPIHTEAVAWISGKPYLFLTLFILASYLLYYRATNPMPNDKSFGFLWYYLSLACFSYFIISNYSFFSLFPLFLILSDMTFDRWRRNWLRWIPFIVIVIVRLILAQNMALERVSFMRGAISSPVVRGPLAYPISVLYAHFTLLIWPIKLSFCHNPVYLQALHNWAIFILIILLLFIAFKAAREIFFGLSIFILFLAPVYSPIPVVSSFVAERYIYFPSVALSIAFAFFYERCAIKYKKLKKYALVMFVLLTIAYGARTIIRNRDWKGPAQFWRRTVAVSPGNPRAHNRLGLVYLAEGDIEKAIEEYGKAIELYPNYVDAHNNLGLAYDKLGNKEKAVYFFQRARELKQE